MKRWRWMVLVGIVAVVGISAWVWASDIWSPGDSADITGYWTLSGRVVVTGVDGEKYREKLGGYLSVYQQGALVQLLFEELGAYFQGYIGAKGLVAIEVDYGGGPTWHSVLDARVSRNGRRLSGRF